MAKEKTLKPSDLPRLRKTVFTEDEIRRKNAPKRGCPYRTKLVWDAEKQKYVKIKIYRKRTTLTRAEIKERFGTVSHAKANTINLAQAMKKTEKHVVHAKTTVDPNNPKKIHCFMRGIKLDWDNRTLRYKNAA